jgi:hypothetical protein
MTSRLCHNNVRSYTSKPIQNLYVLDIKSLLRSKICIYYSINTHYKVRMMSNYRKEQLYVNCLQLDVYKVHQYKKEWWLTARPELVNECLRNVVLKIYVHIKFVKWI